MAPMNEESASLLLCEMRLEADNVLSLLFRHPDGIELAQWAPGAHIEIALPSGKLRQYSLCGDPGDRLSYRVAVLRQATGRGGSVEVCDKLRVGERYNIRGPRNHFEFQEAGSYLFIAGGIGITPILPMIEAVGDRANWRALYCGRERRSMAFVDRFHGRDKVSVWCDNEKGQPDLVGLIAGCEPGTHIYCCGPESLLKGVTEACKDRGDITLRFERFAAAPVTAATHSAGFEVVLAKTGCTLTVPADQSVLQVVREVIPTIPYSCENGFCGSCETRVLEGEVDHRDQLLTESERKANKAMMICVSRACSSRLVLDL